MNKAIKRMQVKSFLKRYASLMGKYEEYNHNNLKHYSAADAIGGFPELEEFEKRMNELDIDAILSEKADNLYDKLYNARAESGESMLGNKDSTKPFKQALFRRPFGAINKNLTEEQLDKILELAKEFPKIEKKFPQYKQAVINQHLMQEKQK